MRSAVVIVVVMALILGMALADVYMHAPRGSNNRLNENTATRTNANRLFDSQNNNRGGCNAGECTKNTATDGDLSNYPATTYNIKEATAKQYAETYYEKSKLTFAWTNQHGCGGDPENDPHNMHCHIVIQYMCEGDYLNDPALQVRLYNGQNTGTPNNPDAPTTAKADATRTANDAAKRGRHENELYYAECAARGRNTGLFIADQNVGDNAINTRQNPNGNRSGLECAEERDYYPYWGPTPWKDVVYMTSEKNVVNVDACKMVREQSQNTAKKAKCIPTAANRANNDAEAKKAIKEITKDGCEAAGGVWQADFTWGLKAPECVEAAWTRDNHLGSTRDGYYQNYTWTVPTFEEIQKGRSAPISGDVVKCVARLRYNITTGDYDNWNTFSESNGAANSPVKNNPTVDIGVGQPLKLALNTAQTGRTFQDRTHVFTVRRRPSGMTQDITNLMVIGKKGNIVQTYPAVEYYWIPEKPEVKVGHYLHIQWTGSASHNNNAPGGDGQDGNGGGGGLDRNNFVLTAGEEYSWAIPLDKAKPDSTLFDQSDCYRPVGATAAVETLDKKNCAVTLATSGHFTTTALTDTHSGDFAANNNNSPPSLINGILLKPKKAGKHPFMSSPNNNFTNRSQKGVVVVKN